MAPIRAIAGYHRGDEPAAVLQCAAESRMRWTRRVEMMLAAGFPLLALLAYLLFYALGW